MSTQQNEKKNGIGTVSALSNMTLENLLNENFEMDEEAIADEEFIAGNDLTILHKDDFVLLDSEDHLDMAVTYQVGEP